MSALETLYCEIGNHEFTRVSTRGRKPKNCEKHKPATPVITHRERNSEGKVSLHCVAGNHSWDRLAQRGRPPFNCPQHTIAAPPRSVPVRVVSSDNLSPNEVSLKEYEDGGAMVLIMEDGFYNDLPKPELKKRGRPKLYNSPEEQEEAARLKSRKRVDELENNLKARGTHLSQQVPYKLFKLVKGVAGHKNAVYEFIEEHSPLARETFLNANEAKFLAKEYKYERNEELISV